MDQAPSESTLFREREALGHVVSLGETWADRRLRSRTRQGHGDRSGRRRRALAAANPRISAAGPLRILFVGGDLDRKGGRLLLAAADRLRARADVPEFEVNLVTPSNVDETDGVVVHRDLTPNSPALIEQYHRADIFCLPTLGDCLPMVLAEAGAAGLALISTDVGAIGEIVRSGETGMLIEAGDVDQLESALHALLTDDELRARCGQNAEALIRASHDASANAGRLIAVLAAAAD